MNGTQFKSLVRFSPDGPAMAVEGPAEIEGRVWCVWSKGDYVYGGDFPIEALVAAEPESELIETLRFEQTAAE